MSLYTFVYCHAVSHLVQSRRNETIAHSDVCRRRAMRGFRRTGEAQYLKKARALGDEATIVQRGDGSYPTWWRPDSPSHADWLNCMIATAEAMELLAETTD